MRKIRVPPREIAQRLGACLTGNRLTPAWILVDGWRGSSDRVNDNDAILERAREVLAPAGVVVGMAKDGPSALRAAEALRPDVIVLDISMPPMTGFEVAAKLRQSGSTAALLFLTAQPDEDFVIKARALGAIGYVVKPRLVSDLMHAVSEAHAGRGFVSPLR